MQLIALAIHFTRPYGGGSSFGMRLMMPGRRSVSQNRSRETPMTFALDQQRESALAAPQPREVFRLSANTPTGTLIHGGALVWATATAGASLHRGFSAAAGFDL